MYLADKGQTPESLSLNTNSPASNILFAGVRARYTLEVGGLLIINSVTEGAEFTQSTIGIIGGGGLANSVEVLESGGPETTTPNQDRRIPASVYSADSYSSAIYPNNFIFSKFSQFRKIVISTGNIPRNAEGCAMPECTRGAGIVGASREATGEIQSFTNSEHQPRMTPNNNVRFIIRQNIPQ